MDRGFDALSFIGIVTLFYIVYRLYIKANENEQVITEFVRRLALKDISKKKVNRKRKIVKKLKNRN